MTDAKQDGPPKQSPIVTGPDGRLWYGMVDDSERWNKFIRRHRPHPYHDEYRIERLREMMLCNANRHLDLSKAGPLRSPIEDRCKKTATPDEIVAAGVDYCVSREDKYTCIADVRVMISARYPATPIVPVDFAKTTAMRCGVALDDSRESQDLVRFVDRERMCVLGGQAICDDGHYPRDPRAARFKRVCAYALNVGATPEAAFCMGDAVNGPRRPFWWNRS